MFVNFSVTITTTLRRGILHKLSTEKKKVLILCLKKKSNIVKLMKNDFQFNSQTSLRIHFVLL